MTSNEDKKKADRVIFKYLNWFFYFVIFISGLLLILVISICSSQLGVI